MKKRITKDQYLIGEENGISRRNVYQRWYSYGYDIERAITEPLHKPVSHWTEWKETAKANGVSNELFSIRVRKGMTPEKAATTAVSKVGGNMRKKKHIL